MIKTEFIELYERLSTLTEKNNSSGKYIPKVYAIFEHADEYVWDLLWVGTDENSAWDEWERTQEWSNEYRGPNYPIYLVEYSEDLDNPLTADEFKELTSFIDPNNKDEDQIKAYYNMGNTIDEYCSDEYDEYEEDEIEEDDYDEEEDEATLIPRISVTIIPKNKKDMSLLTKHIEGLCQDANSVNALETCVAGRWEYREPIFEFDEEYDYYDFFNDRVTLYFVGEEVDYHFLSDAYSLEGAVKQDLDFDSLVRIAEVNDPDNIVESLVACLFKESIEEDFLDEFKCFEGSKYAIKYSVEPSDEQHSFQDGPFVVKEATITY